MTTKAIPKNDFKQTEIGEIPADWDLKPLRAVCAETTTINPAKNPNAVIEYVDVSSVSREGCRIVGATKYAGKDAPGRARNLVRHRDVIFATVRPTLRRVALVPKELDGQVVSTAFCVIRAQETQAHPEYLYYVVSSPDFVARVGRLERGASYPAVTDANIFTQKIALPSRPEQERIAGVLSRIQVAVVNQEKIVSDLRELKAAFMEQLFSAVSTDWKFIRISDLGDIVTGTTPPTSVQEHYGGTIPFVSPADMGNIKYLSSAYKTLSSHGLKVSRPLPINSTLFVCIGSTIGKVAITGVDNVCTNQQINAIVPNRGYLAEFVFYLLQWNSAKIQSMGNNGPMPILTKGAFGKIDVLATEKKEIQENIINVISPIDFAIEIALRKKRVSEDLFKSTLIQLVSGKIRVY